MTEITRPALRYHGGKFRLALWVLQFFPPHEVYTEAFGDAAGVPFLFKQWGEWIPMMGHTEGVPITGPKSTFPDGTVMGHAGKKAAGRLLDGREHNGFPEVRHA